MDEGTCNENQIDGLVNRLGTVAKDQVEKRKQDQVIGFLSSR
jgi:hypothetical protein